MTYSVQRIATEKVDSASPYGMPKAKCGMTRGVRKKTNPLQCRGLTVHGPLKGESRLFRIGQCRE